ncbi:MAG: ABC transporter substrate-binding protein [Alphaproteobacteria bacterium]|nr:ABC transporter substrate-binding protein [Alphaproteobacteria bacterium]
MKKIYAVIFGAFMLCALPCYAQSESVKAENFIKKVTTQGIEQIINANVSQEEKDKRFEKLFNEYLDLDFIGKFVLGRYWNTAKESERTEFIDVYRQMNIKTWSKRFDEFKGKQFVFNGTSPSNSKNQIFVNTTVPMKQGAPAKVIWRVKDTNGTLKVVDIIIENVSLAITARNEYTAYIKKSKNGVADLIADLRQKSK